SEAVIGRHRAVVAADSSRILAPRSLGILPGQDTLTVPDLDAKLAAQVLGLGCGFLPSVNAAADIAAGRLVVRKVGTPRAPQRIHLAWRAPRPGKALAWWIDAIGQADWRFLAMAPSPDTRAAPRHGRR